MAMFGGAASAAYSVTELLERYTLAKLYNMAKGDRGIARTIIEFSGSAADLPNKFRSRFAYNSFEALQLKLALRYPRLVRNSFLESHLPGFSDWYTKTQHSRYFYYFIRTMLKEFLSNTSGAHLQHAFRVEGNSLSDKLTCSSLFATNLSDNPVLLILMVCDETYIETVRELKVPMSVFCAGITRLFRKDDERGASKKLAKDSCATWSEYSTALIAREAELMHRMDAISAAALTAGGRRGAEESCESPQFVPS